MDNPRSDKVAVVDEVREKLGSSDAVVFTEYRGLTVTQMAELRRALAGGGGEYRVLKNTLVRIAAKSLDHGDALDEKLTGPTALAFVGQRPDGTPGDPVVVAKALKAFAKANPELVIKGGLLGDNVLSTEEINALAEVAPREELLARFAGGLAAPMRNMAALLNAMTTNFAYGLQALIDAGGASGAPAAADTGAEAPEPAADDPSAGAAEASDEPTEDTPTAEATDAAADVTEGDATEEE